MKRRHLKGRPDDIVSILDGRPVMYWQMPFRDPENAISFEEACRLLTLSIRAAGHAESFAVKVKECKVFEMKNDLFSNLPAGQKVVIGYVEVEPEDVVEVEEK